MWIRWVLRVVLTDLRGVTLTDRLLRNHRAPPLPTTTPHWRSIRDPVRKRTGMTHAIKSGPRRWGPLRCAEKR